MQNFSAMGRYISFWSFQFDTVRFLNSFCSFPKIFKFGFGQTPEGLANLMRTVERKPSETAEQMRHRVYSRLYGIMWVSDYLLNVKFHISEK